MAKKVLVTGAAGFVGSHLLEALTGRGDTVIGLDNLNDYYDPERKRANIREVSDALEDPKTLTFIEGDIRDAELVERLVDDELDAVVNLAAMAGVRASIDDPFLYYDVNLNGVMVLLERITRLKQQGGKAPKFVQASTSSVYGATERIPFVEDDPCDRPLAPYPASKRAAELACHTYHHLFGLDTINVRFFTVYGPRGRPDMMAYKVADNIYFGRDVPLFNGGKMHRDWTFVTDIVQGVVGAVDRGEGYLNVNLGRGEPVLLADFVAMIEEFTGKSSGLYSEPMPDADVPYTYADVSRARDLLGYDPKVSVRDGVSRFLQWYEKAVLAKSR